jgi:hypothetical protein
MDRRRFLIAGAAAVVTARSFAQDSSARVAKLTLYPNKAGFTIPENFVGLSYETQQLSDAHFFSPANQGLIAQFRALAPHGVLRLGGNTSDYAFFKSSPQATPPPRAKRPYKVGDPNPNLTYDVTPEAVRNLRGFLDATEWTCLYGINLGTNTPELAAEEAVFVNKTLGDKLEYFQIGNEADRFGSTIRDPRTWNANTYMDEWLKFADAIRARVPGAKFGLPDTAGNPEWYAVVVDRLIALSDPPRVGALTHHYYFGGPPSNPKVNINAILHPDPHVNKLASDISAAASRLGKAEHRRVSYRMTEGNTCYRGGKPGVSDVFAASMWAADYLLKLASLGYSGANLHGGEGKMVANSLGGTLPGEALMPDPHVPHPRPFYTPIADIDGRYVAEPVSFGMRFAQRFAGATLLELDFDPGAVNATAYAARLTDGRTLVAIINKDATNDLRINQPKWRTVETLTAPKLTSTKVILGSPANPHATIVPAASAAIFEVLV